MNRKSDNGGDKNHKRSLPSWMDSSEDESKSHGKMPTNDNRNVENDKIEESKQAKEHGKSTQSGSCVTTFSKLMEGVVFVLSGFVNPERSTLRSQAIEMGASYRADWNSDCTLLVCAFPNTPKFRQVEADAGTIVSKEWILECYKQKKLVDIESYLMHVGKPWRKSNMPDKTCGEGSPRSKSHPVERGSRQNPTASTSSMQLKASDPTKAKFSPSQLKKWVADDLDKTVSWLESQEEKPDEGEIKQVAAGGILTCLQDAIDLLEQNKDMRQITEQWQCIPHVVSELAKLVDSTGNCSREDICKQAMTCKRVYEDELRRLESDSKTTKKQKATSSDAAGYDSDRTIEMTEEEIDLAYKTVTS